MPIAITMIANRNDVDNNNNNNNSSYSNHSERRPFSNRKPSLDSVKVMDDGESSVFSEENPLPSDFDERNRRPRHYQHLELPRAVAMTGWSRTVGADETRAPPPNIQLGAPGTGLSSAALATEKALGRTLGRKAREQQASSGLSYTARGKSTWGKACVTADDLAAAAALRKIRPPDGAVPLPSPRPWSETDACTFAGSPEWTARRRLERGLQSCSSSTSSDLNFLVAPGTGSFFGTRPTVGRTVDKRIPATVGEATLHDSLAKFFGNRVEEQSEGWGNSANAPTARTAAISTSSQKSDEQSAGTCTALINFTPPTKSATRESSFDDGTRGEGIAAASSACAGERGTTRLIADGSVDFSEVGPLEMRFYPSMSAADGAAAAAIRDATVLEKMKRDRGKGVLFDKGTQRRPRKGKQGAASRRSRRSSSDIVNGRQGETLCGCATTWPWKVGRCNGTVLSSRSSCLVVVFVRCGYGMSQLLKNRFTCS